jgi:hypothetical protein
LDDQTRHEIARRRLVSILQSHKAANMRTIEQKISDAGPYNQRIDPHKLTTARNELTAEGIIDSRLDHGVTWYFLKRTPPPEVTARIAVLGPIWARTAKQGFTMRVGQSLEITVFRALKAQSSLNFLGAFLDLDTHDDSSLYKKEEPPFAFSGRTMPGDMRFDFLALHPSAGPAGIEVKNVREWFYPERREIRDLIFKCCSLNAVPVLVARRIAYSTFSVLNPCGLVIHQTFNQRYPASDADLAALARDRTLLGFHDILLGNDPDRRLTKFINVNLPKVLPAAREAFTKHHDLLSAYANGDMPYEEFAARVKLRQRGEEGAGPLPF